ncbi:hypothetical protein, partial [Klebsiella pneumoniae]|uniref:hypothetical protein n=1 Tax=Klebsiella pneumoniae TaxID=573 RepID=UPI0037BFD1BA
MTAGQGRVEQGATIGRQGDAIGGHGERRRRTVGVTQPHLLPFHDRHEGGIGRGGYVADQSLGRGASGEV